MIRTLEEFKKIAATFGKADAATLEFRDKCKKAGYSVVFYDGMTREKALSIIESAETKRILFGSSVAEQTIDKGQTLA